MKKRSAWFLVGIAVVSIVGAFFIYPTSFGSWLYDSVEWKLGLDLVGGTRLEYRVDTSHLEGTDTSSTLSGLRDVIERRVNLFGVKEPQVSISQSGNEYRLIVELAGVSDIDEAVKQIGETPFLDFRELEEGEEKGSFFYVPTELDGRYVEGAQLSFNQTTGEPQVTISFTSEGADLFSDITRRNIGNIVGIFLDNEVIQEPRVNEHIPSGEAVISGSYTLDEAKKLVSRFNAGALPAPIERISQQNIGAGIGRDALDASLFAGIVGTIAIMLFMILYYRWKGVLASVALLIYVILTLSVFKLFVTLTLAGIAGFLLSVGMAVDANILIFERTKEELRKGASYMSAVSEGFSRAWPSIRDSNITTIITALILFQFTSSFVKGLALTLLLGVLISMFSAIVVTRNLMILFSRKK